MKKMMLVLSLFAAALAAHAGSEVVYVQQASQTLADDRGRFLPDGFMDLAEEGLSIAADDHGVALAVVMGDPVIERYDDSDDDERKFRVIFTIQGSFADGGNQVIVRLTEEKRNKGYGTNGPNFVPEMRLKSYQVVGSTEGVIRFDD